MSSEFTFNLSKNLSHISLIIQRKYLIKSYHKLNYGHQGSIY